MDAIDRHIVELLTVNGRLTYAELARQIGLSGPAVHERVGKLESSGVIEAYRAHARWLLDGYVRPALGDRPASQVTSGDEVETSHHVRRAANSGTAWFRHTPMALSSARGLRSALISG